jgi:two-component system, LytTR family, sensor kinase
MTSFIPAADAKRAGGADAHRMTDDAADEREAREEARRWVRRLRVLYTILGVYAALSVMWFLIDLADDSEGWWFYWPMLGVGVAVAIAAVFLLGLGGLLGADWERRQEDRYLARRRRDQR